MKLRNPKAPLNTYPKKAKRNHKYSRPSYKHQKEEDVLQALVSHACMRAVNRKFNLREASRISEYLETRGTSYIEFRLIQFMAGSLPNDARSILAFRRSQSLKQFSLGLYPFLKKTDEEINDLYLDVYTRLSNNTKNFHAQTFFKKMRFICALDIANNIKTASKILAVGETEIQHFIDENKLSFPWRKNLKSEEVYKPDEIKEMHVISPQINKTQGVADADKIEPFPLGRFSIFESDDWVSGTAFSETKLEAEFITKLSGQA